MPIEIAQTSSSCSYIIIICANYITTQSFYGYFSNRFGLLTFLLVPVIVVFSFLTLFYLNFFFFIARLLFIYIIISSFFVNCAFIFIFSDFCKHISIADFTQILKRLKLSPHNSFHNMVFVFIFQIIFSGAFMCEE